MENIILLGFFKELADTFKECKLFSIKNAHSFEFQLNDTTAAFVLIEDTNKLSLYPNKFNHLHDEVTTRQVIKLLESIYF